MGMAASQARFLGLTARKTNTEYEGQQVNQQRTTLSNESANYYNQLLGMTVPVPPAVADYTKTVYSFNDGALSSSINSLVAQKDGTYLVSYTSTWTNDFSTVATSPLVYTADSLPVSSTSKFLYGNVMLRELNTGIDANGNITDADFANDEYLNSLSADQRKNLLAEEQKYITQLNAKYGPGTWLVRYVKNSSSAEWTPYFVKKDVLTASGTVYDDVTLNTLSGITTYTVGSALESEEIKGVVARLEQDASGRIIKITLKPGEVDQVTYPVSTNTVTDQAKYDDAMNQYEYDKHQYDQTVTEINAKIEIIQAEDKNLELRLKQLDTEQEAIQTEMDAVQKVIEKNTESTFKTFG